MPTGPRGRPRSTSWSGKLGAWIGEYTVQKLADELAVDPTQVYRWARGDATPPVRRAVAITEVARSAGTPLSLEDIYEAHIVRCRCRMRSRS
jgi:DNA-binding transcriptional regulator YdaS (Cro superfamily)